MENLNDPELAKHEKKLKEYQNDLKTLMNNIKRVARMLQPK